MKKYDVIIVGGGPAGLMAARELTRHNLKYLIIESKHTIGYPLRCGELTRERTLLELFDHTNYSFVKNEIHNVSFQVKDTQKVIKRKMIMLDKQEFLVWLSMPIRSNLQFNTTLEHISRKNGILEAITNKGVFQAKLFIFAYGTNYRIQRELGLLVKDVELIPCVGGLFKNKTLSRDTANLYFDEESNIASWVFPKDENVVNAGSGVMLKNSKVGMDNLKDAFEKSMINLAIPLAGKLSFGGSCVTNGPIAKTYSDNVLFCGDAAGQVFAFIGEGIYYSLKAGQIAGKIAIKAIRSNEFDARFLRIYEDNWKKSFGLEMDAGVTFATVLFFLIKHHLTYDTLRIIKPKEIEDIWMKGKVSLRIKLFHSLLRLLACSPKR
jgi:digeranylgeranylglycerophospholipid reductase